MVMNYFFPIFGCFLIFIAWFSYESKKTTNLEKKREDDFWQREVDANSIRRVPLDSLTYIQVPDSILLPSLSAKDTKDDELLKCNDELLSLQQKRIFNLTGMTATDIKMTYGPANLNDLDEYDTNYTHLVKTIYQFGARLLQLNFTEDGIKVLEFGIDSLTDISGNYKLLADLYVKKNDTQKLAYLLETAYKLDSLNKNSIINYINSVQTTSL